MIFKQLLSWHQFYADSCSSHRCFWKSLVLFVFLWNGKNVVGCYSTKVYWWIYDCYILDRYFLWHLLSRKFPLYHFFSLYIFIVTLSIQWVYRKALKLKEDVILTFPLVLIFTLISFLRLSSITRSSLNAIKATIVREHQSECNNRATYFHILTSYYSEFV